MKSFGTESYTVICDKLLFIPLLLVDNSCNRRNSSSRLPDSGQKTADCKPPCFILPVFQIAVIKQTLEQGDAYIFHPSTSSWQTSISSAPFPSPTTAANPYQNSQFRESLRVSISYWETEDNLVFSWAWEFNLNMHVLTNFKHTSLHKAKITRLGTTNTWRCWVSTEADAFIFRKL